MSFAAIGLKLLFGGKWLLELAKAVLDWAIKHPWQIACAVFIGLWLITRGDLRDERDISAALRVAVNAEMELHRKTKADYRKAQADAAKLETQRLVRVKAEQQEITDEVVENYSRRLADARAHAGRLRSERSPTGTELAGAGGTVDVPGAGIAPGRADEAPGDRGLPQPARQLTAAELDWRLIATEQAIQLDELITFVERQAKVEVNEPPAGDVQ